MTSDREHLNRQIEELRKRMETSRYVLSGERRESFLASLESLARRLSAAIDPILHVGLLGGTGVGKSTLINALAEEPISSVSDRRPHTDRIVVYRHEAVSLPDAIPSGLLREPHQTHESQKIRHLVAYDLPDFDSILTGHREQAMAFLAHLDLVIWVSSPEKYADLRFYEVLRASEKHQENFVFVLNKVDKLSPPDGDSSQEVAKLIGDFSLKLKDAGIQAPRIHHFAAKEAQNPQAPPWLRDDYLRFRQALFRQRDQKEILAIKAANIEVELAGLWRELRSAGIRLAPLQSELESLLLNFRNRGPNMKKRIFQVLEQFFTARTSAFLRQSILSRQEDVAPVALLSGLWKKPANPFAVGDDQAGWESPLHPDDERLRSLEGEFTIPLDNLAALLHRFDLTHATKELGDLERELKTDWRSVLVLGAESFAGLALTMTPPWKRWTGWARRSWQRFWLAVPAGFLLIALAGPEKVESFFQGPGILAGLRMLLNVALSLFRPEGLAAVLAFFAIEILICLWLASRAVQKTERRIQKARDTFNRELAQACFETVMNRMRRLEEMGRKLIDEIQEISPRGTPGDLA